MVAAIRIPMFMEQHNQQLDNTRKYIDSIDFTKIIDKLIKLSGWRREDAERTCEQYRNFLFLNKKYRYVYDYLVPSHDIDEFWHNHILDTKSYETDCQIIFGSLLHHNPYSDADIDDSEIILDDTFEITKNIYFYEFGVDIEPTKSRYPDWAYYLLKMGR
jgi:hypothetical protein